MEYSKPLTIAVDGGSVSTLTTHHAQSNFGIDAQIKSSKFKKKKLADLTMQSHEITNIRGGQSLQYRKQLRKSGVVDVRYSELMLLDKLSHN